MERYKVLLPIVDALRQDKLEGLQKEIDKVLDTYPAFRNQQILFFDFAKCCSKQEFKGLYDKYVRFRNNLL